jgi:spheroidene monooxygenase
VTQAVSLSFFRFSGAVARLWAFGQMGLARRAIARTPGIGFWKLCGSGTGEGFTPVPNTAVYAILATWDDIAAARRGVASPAFRRFRDRAVEHWTVFLIPISSRGQWSGQEPFRPDRAAATAQGRALAALTRATLRPRIAWRFWGRVPDISAMIGRNADVAFKIGIGEVPLLHQVTFSIWPDAKAMAAFARTGPHAAAIRAVREEGWFREELYARFAVHSDIGSWNGISPLSRLEAA